MSDISFQQFHSRSRSQLRGQHGAGYAVATSVAFFANSWGVLTISYFQNPGLPNLGLFTDALQTPFAITLTADRNHRNARCCNLACVELRRSARAPRRRNESALMRCREKRL